MRRSDSNRICINGCIDESTDKAYNVKDADYGR